MLSSILKQSAQTIHLPQEARLQKNHTTKAPTLFINDILPHVLLYLDSQTHNQLKLVSRDVKFWVENYSFFTASTSQDFSQISNVVLLTDIREAYTICLQTDTLYISLINGNAPGISFHRALSDTRAMDSVYIPEDKMDDEIRDIINQTKNGIKSNKNSLVKFAKQSFSINNSLGENKIFYGLQTGGLADLKRVLRQKLDEQNISHLLDNIPDEVRGAFARFTLLGIPTLLCTYFLFSRKWLQMGDPFGHLFLTASFISCLEGSNAASYFIHNTNELWLFAYRYFKLEGEINKLIAERDAIVDARLEKFYELLTSNSKDLQNMSSLI